MQTDLNSKIMGARNRNHLFKISCLIAASMLSFTLTVQATILDDLFQWAAQQPPSNVTTVQFAMTGNEITRNGLVSYAVGTLTYYPGGWNGHVFLPARFASTTNGIKQYFSDRTYNCNPLSFTTYPFNPNNTDPLTVTVSRAVFGAIYSVDLASSKWGFNFQFRPSVDANTNILYGSMGPTFLTVSLYNRHSAPPPIIQ